MPAEDQTVWNVRAWRYEELLRAGWPVEYAVELAERDDIDLHRACDLLKQGVPVSLALKIIR